MGLQYQRVRGDCPITITVPNDGSVRGYLITKCVVANQGGGSAAQGVTVTHDTVQLASLYLAPVNGDNLTSINGAALYGGFGNQYFEKEIDGGGATVSILPKTKDIREAAGVWLAPGDVFMVAGTGCKGSVSYFEEI